MQKACDVAFCNFIFHLIIKKAECLPKHSANVKIRGSYEKKNCLKVFLVLTKLL